MWTPACLLAELRLQIGLGQDGTLAYVRAHNRTLIDEFLVCVGYRSMLRNSNKSLSPPPLSTLSHVSPSWKQLPFLYFAHAQITHLRRALCGSCSRFVPWVCTDVDPGAGTTAASPRARSLHWCPPLFAGLPAARPATLATCWCTPGSVRAGATPPRTGDAQVSRCDLSLACGPPPACPVLFPCCTSCTWTVVPLCPCSC
jgi:hypothetical protein